MKRCLPRVLALLALWLCAHPALAHADVARFALVIGNNRPDSPGDALLEYADDDALSLHQVFVEAGIRSVLLTTPDQKSRSMHPHSRPDGPARESLLREHVADLFADMRAAKSRGSRVEFFLFFSGHGGVSGAEGYIMLEDARFDRGELSALLRDSPADINHVFIDACCSFFMAFAQRKGSAPEHRTPFSGSFPFERVPGERVNTGFVLSTASERDSHEWTRYRGGILSHELRSALRGAADANTDGHVSYRELQRFLEVVNAGIDNGNFRPEITVVAPDNDAAFDVLEWGDPDRAPLRVVGGSIRHFYVEDANGVRLLDAHPEPGRVVSLWLPAARPIFVRANDEPYDFSIFDSDPVTVDHLVSVEPDLRRKGGGSLGFALEGLFTLPFGPASFLGLAHPEAPRQQAPLAWTRAAAASVAIGAAGVGVVLSASALDAYLDRRDGTQLDRDARHRDFRRYNRLSIPCYILAAAAGVTWGWLEYQPSFWLSPSADAGSSMGAWGVDVGGSF
jgi:hypothetical protein